MCDDVVAELRAFDLRGAFHQAGEVVGDFLGSDSAIQALNNEVSSFGPAEVAEHHFARENN